MSDGLTGDIQFDTHGRRTEFQLDVIKVSAGNGTQKIGTWNSGRQQRLNFTQTKDRVTPDSRPDIKGRHFIVTTALVRNTPNFEYRGRWGCTKAQIITRELVKKTKCLPCLLALGLIFNNIETIEPFDHAPNGGESCKKIFKIFSYIFDSR